MLERTIAGGRNLASNAPYGSGNVQPPPGPKDRPFVERIKRLILTPREEWMVIDAEPMTERQIIAGWVVPLAAIGPIARLIGTLTFGYYGFGISYRPSVASAVLSAVVAFVMTIVATWILARIIDALAPTFSGTRNPVSAMKVAAYSSTAAWLAAGFGILPTLAFLSILGLYSLYLLYLGLPLLMKVPLDKAVGYVVATIIAAVVVLVVVSSITAAITYRMMTPFLSGYPIGT